MHSRRCSTGWITHWGEPMANTSAADLAGALQTILRYGNGSGSVNLYMAHGGTNWGFWAGALLLTSPTAPFPST